MLPYLCQKLPSSLLRGFLDGFIFFGDKRCLHLLVIQYPQQGDERCIRELLLGKVKWKNEDFYG